MKNVKNNKVEMLEMENMVKEMKVVFNGPISRLNIAIKTTNTFKARTIEITQAETQSGKTNGVSKSCGTVSVG